MRFEGRVALIGGAAGGIGGGIAERLAAEGARIAAVDLDAAGAERVAAAVRAAGGEAIALEADLSRPDPAAGAVRDTVAALGRLDVVVNGVGVPGARPVEAADDAEWDRVVGAELKSCYALLRPAILEMTAAKYGRVLILSSRDAFGMGGQALHSAAKAGVLGFTRALALEVGRFGITVNAISPYYVDTPGLRAGDPSAVERAARATAVRRAGTPADVAAAAAFLASEEAGFVTGQVLSVCGGSNIGLLQW